MPSTTAFFIAVIVYVVDREELRNSFATAITAASVMVEDLILILKSEVSEIYFLSLIVSGIVLIKVRFSFCYMFIPKLPQVPQFG